MESIKGVQSMHARHGDKHQYKPYGGLPDTEETDRVRR